jgi:hypothetical protein
MKIKLKSESKVNTEDATTINEQAEQIKRMQNIILVLREDYKTLNIKTEELRLANEYIRRRLPEICNIIMDEFISGKERR